MPQRASNCCRANKAGKSLSLQKQLKDIGDFDLGNPLHDLLIDLKHAGELNEIRIAVSEFQDLYKIDDPIQRQAKADDIDRRVNALRVVQTECSKPIHSIDLYGTRSPYAELQKICPALDKIPVPKAMKLIA